MFVMSRAVRKVHGDEMADDDAFDNQSDVLCWSFCKLRCCLPVGTGVEL